MADKVYVYGTLMKGHGNHGYYLSQSEFLGKGEITGYALYAVSSPWDRTRGRREG